MRRIHCKAISRATSKSVYSPKVVGRSESFYEFKFTLYTPIQHIAQYHRRVNHPSVRPCIAPISPHPFHPLRTELSTLRIVNITLCDAPQRFTIYTIYSKYIVQQCQTNQTYLPYTQYRTRQKYHHI